MNGLDLMKGRRLSSKTFWEDRAWPTPDLSMFNKMFLQKYFFSKSKGLRDTNGSCLLSIEYIGLPKR